MISTSEPLSVTLVMTGAAPCELRLLECLIPARRPAYPMRPQPGQAPSPCPLAQPSSQRLTRIEDPFDLMVARTPDRLRVEQRLLPRWLL